MSQNTFSPEQDFSDWDLSRMFQYSQDLQGATGRDARLRKNIDKLLRSRLDELNSKKEQIEQAVSQGDNSILPPNYDQILGELEEYQAVSSTLPEVVKSINRKLKNALIRPLEQQSTIEEIKKILLDYPEVKRQIDIPSPLSHYF